MYHALALPCSPNDVHERIYKGQILAIDAQPAMAKLVTFADEFLREALFPHTPALIHQHWSHAQQAEGFTRCQADFHQAHEANRLWVKLMEDIGLDPVELACDRLHLRFQPPPSSDAPASRARATATIAFHRDTWGSNLYAQTNWWAPIYPVSAQRTFAMYPHLWDQPLQNTSAEFDLASVLARSQAGGRNSVDADQATPHLLETVDASLGQPVVIAPGSIIAFSGAHAHAGVPNSSALTRISFETRTLWLNDLRKGRGAPNIDGHARWMSPGFFRCLSDGQRLHEWIGCSYLTLYKKGQKYP
ncbi:hypothetical protein QN366_00745 [Pseudomonas sp. CCC3.2]|uniref:hypothetical protein n=1 Tax=unclassified Pseudomonas TaxID=196821 RepID=UPI002AB44D22|nr:MULTISPECIES: hypothetical protein [unclassified Pseudomonas]MDY7559693.1 hypothetical protein [Pseudomonas sp. AB6]MEB0178598.1 hypothetical protein [Pseudomonas sp. CCC3.2]MEB0209950.1 hypothetical protein [Pseudomonas sp. AB6]